MNASIGTNENLAPERPDLRFLTCAAVPDAHGSALGHAFFVCLQVLGGPGRPRSLAISSSSEFERVGRCGRAARRGWGRLGDAAPTGAVLGVAASGAWRCRGERSRA